MDFQAIFDILANIIKSISSVVYNFANQIYPQNPNLVVLITAIATIYLLHDKISTLLLIGIAVIFLYIVLTGGGSFV